MATVECPVCQAKNRVERFRVRSQARCGKCGGSLREPAWVQVARNAYRYRYQIGAAALVAAGIYIYQQRPQPARTISAEPAWTPQTMPPFEVKVDRPAIASSGRADLARLTQSPSPPLTCVPVAVTSGSSKIYSGQRGLAPLKLTTPSGDDNYLVKLVKVGTKSVVVSAYVRGGDTKTFKVPLGSYVIYYAQGKVWCGENDGFGRGNTRLVRLAGNFEFTREPDGYAGHEIELIQQMAGNLRSEEVSDAEFASLVPATPAGAEGSSETR